MAAFMGKTECKKYTRAVLNSLSGENQMKVKKLYEQQYIKPTAKQTSAEARISALDAQLGIISQPRKLMLSKR